MKKLLKRIAKGKATKIIGDVLLGTLAPPLKVASSGVVGIIEGVKHEKKANLISEIGGQGRPNYARILGYLIFIGLTALLIMGKINKETFEYLLDLFLEMFTFE